VHTVALAGHATDGMLERLAGPRRVPSITALDLSQSLALTNEGVRALFSQTSGRGEGAWRQLRVLDLSFCARTTYELVLELRHTFSPPLIVQRLPHWLQGKFETPWGEQHTYFADGSFSFDRHNQAAGYVRWLRRVQPSATAGGGGEEAESLAHFPFLTDSLQYVDFEPPPAWPLWVRYCYRPGVALCPHPRATSGGVRHILVAQLLRGLRAPLRLPPVLVEAVPLGGRVFCNRDGELAPAGVTEEAATGSYECMLSCMPVTPLWSLPHCSSLVEVALAVLAASAPADASRASHPPNPPRGSLGSSPARALTAVAGPDHAQLAALQLGEHAWQWLLPPTELLARIEAFEKEREAEGLEEALLEGVIADALGSEEGHGDLGAGGDGGAEAGAGVEADSAHIEAHLAGMAPGAAWPRSAAHDGDVVDWVGDES